MANPSLLNLQPKSTAERLQDQYTERAKLSQAQATQIDAIKAIKDAIIFQSGKLDEATKLFRQEYNSAQVQNVVHNPIDFKEPSSLDRAVSTANQIEKEVNALEQGVNETLEVTGETQAQTLQLLEEAKSYESVCHLLEKLAEEKRKKLALSKEMIKNAENALKQT